MTLAERIKDYYESDDFKGNYTDILMEDRSAVVNRIKDLCKDKNGEVAEAYGGHIWLSDEQAEEIYEFICNNLEEFIIDMNGWYVGYTSIDSVDFGEQEEQLEGNYEEHTPEELKEIFEDADFYVTDDVKYAYYNLSGTGLSVDLLAGEIPMLTEFILEEIKNND